MDERTARALVSKEGRELLQTGLVARTWGNFSARIPGGQFVITPSGLDYAHMIETADLLRQLQGMGATILVVTHDCELLRACCSRRLVFPRKT